MTNFHILVSVFKAFVFSNLLLSAITASLLLLPSQTTHAGEKWNTFVQKTLNEMQSIPGWCSDEKAKCLMNLIHTHKLQIGIEIGVFGGKSLYPIARAMQYTHRGKVFGIDPWDPLQSTKGMNPNDPNFDYWFNIDYETIFNKCKKTIYQSHLDAYCEVLRTSSSDAYTLFQDESLDFIHFDGHHGEEYVLEDVLLYFPKIKNGGFIILNDPCWYSMRSALVYLLERSNIIGSFTSSSSYLIVQKNKIKNEKANNLMNKSERDD